MKRAIIYTRVSTDKQETERQKAELQSYARMLGYEVINVLEDVESGLHDERPNFMKLLSYTKNEIDAVLVWEISRIGRKTSTVIKTIEDWTSKGICFMSKKESLCSLDEDGKMNANTKLFLSIMATIAENEANTIKERMRSGQIFKLRNGGAYSTKTPFGYDKVDGQFVINEEQASKVKQAYLMRKDKVSTGMIAKFLGFEISTTKGILTNEIYKGTARNKYVPDMTFTMPKIVDDELWLQVQATFIRTAKKTDLVFAPLRMKIICPHCGRHYAYGKDKGKHRYYCNNFQEPHPPYCKIIAAEKLEAAVEKAVMKIVGEPKLEDTQFDTPSSIEAYIESLKSKKAEIQRELEIDKKKLDAVRELLTDKEALKEQNQIAKLFDKMMNIDVEIDAANARLTNSRILAAAPMLPMEVTGWWEYIKEIRVTEYRAGYKAFEIELVDGQTTSISIDSPKGWAGIEDKAVKSKIAKDREARRRLQRSQEAAGDEKTKETR